MRIEFSKYHGTGNDFILLDNRDLKYSKLSSEQIKKVCDRHFGVGADGLMLLQKSKDFDFEMKYYNSDGNEGSMCGNGGRCIVAFAKLIGIIDKRADFIAIDGIHYAEIDDSNIVDLKMKSIDIKDIVIENNDYILDTGSPHLVKYIDDVENLDVFNQGKSIRNSEIFFKKGINVNFVKIVKENSLFVRTYERGVENETLSCGTGAVASAVSLYFKKQSNSNSVIEINTLGGTLLVSIDFMSENKLNISLKGSTTRVFNGTIDL
ncbi:MAG: diaminopimelate epimerase [Bacteroidetes bacterium GWA2_31_9]|nr:MAG: diaminopimelate epimerase [Bacteroidetes bacterium GWA2_31_9]